MDLEKLKAKWRERQGQAKVSHRDLRQGRPEPPPLEGSYCQRCDELTPDITCVYLDYWLCPRCAAFHEGLQHRFAYSSSMTTYESVRRGGVSYATPF